MVEHISRQRLGRHISQIVARRHIMNRNFLVHAMLANKRVLNINMLASPTHSCRLILHECNGCIIIAKLLNFYGVHAWLRQQFRATSPACSLLRVESSHLGGGDNRLIINQLIDIY
jgi:hypothetical protein